jgi:hypothetical protein
MPKEYYTRGEAAKYLTEKGLPTSKNTLQKYATVGGGPRYELFGNRSVYRPPNLDSWAAQKLTPPKHSTSEK